MVQRFSNLFQFFRLLRQRQTQTERQRPRLWDTCLRGETSTKGPAPDDGIAQSHTHTHTHLQNLQAMQGPPGAAIPALRHETPARLPWVAQMKELQRPPILSHCMRPKMTCNIVIGEDTVSLQTMSY
eukprot:3126114-Amphidinium_carterae.1